MTITAAFVATLLIAVLPSVLSGLADFNHPKTVTLKQKDDFTSEKDPAGVQRRLRERILLQLTFNECVGRHMSQCKRIIDAAHKTNPKAFNNVAKVTYQVVKVRPPKTTQEIAADPDVLLQVDDYYLVGLRTDETEEYVVGLNGDGVVEYPYAWCLSVDNCVMVGPWDCYFEETTPPTKRTVEECCAVIKADVPFADVHGNYIDCYASPPPPSEGGSVTEEVDYGRVILHVTQDNKVAHPPKNG